MFLIFFFFKQKTAYEIRKGDWSSDVCSSDLGRQYIVVAIGGAGFPAELVSFRLPAAGEIGRASCRERVAFLVLISVVGGSLKKKKNKKKIERKKNYKIEKIIESIKI